MDDYLPQSYGSNMSNMGHRGNEAMMGFVFGAVLGAGLALLFAPAPGNETRRRLGESARKMGSEARHKMDELRHQARGAMNDVKESVGRGVEEAQGVLRHETGGTHTGPQQAGPPGQPAGSRSRI
jgi:gas vesicle protein